MTLVSHSNGKFVNEFSKWITDYGGKEEPSPRQINPEKYLINPIPFCSKKHEGYQEAGQRKNSQFFLLSFALKEEGCSGI